MNTVGELIEWLSKFPLETTFYIAENGCGCCASGATLHIEVEKHKVYTKTCDNTCYSMGQDDD